MNRKDLSAAGVTADQFDLRWPQPQRLGECLGNRVVRATLIGRGADSHSQGAVVSSADRVAPCSGSGMDGQLQRSVPVDDPFE